MTIDGAIKHCEEEAEKYMEYGIETECYQCAKEHEQLAEWLKELKARRLLMDKVCGELAELYGSPCQEPKAEDFMRENGFCEDCQIIISDKECWFRYFQRKFNCARMDGEQND